jgi:hypothetical protein
MDFGVPTTFLMIDIVTPVVISYQLRRKNKREMKNSVTTNPGSKSPSTANKGDESGSSSIIQMIPKSPSMLSTLISRPTIKKARYSDVIDRILVNEEAVELFADFLTKEYCLENLLFVKALAEYRDFAEDTHKTSSELLEKRDLIIREFIIPGSPNEVFIINR